MRTLVHVSDLHFGRADMAVMDALLDAWAEMKPDLVVISGDLTQTAEREEFAAARAFLDAIAAHGLRSFVIPGNHDIEPMYRPLKRLRNAYANYSAYISPQTEHFYHDGEIAIASINTVKRSHPVNGRVADLQIRQATEWFALHPDAVKIIVTHHPLRRNANRNSKLPCWRGERARKALDAASVDVYLCGHQHRSSVVHTEALEVHAGTVSERQRGEVASFNMLAIDSGVTSVETYHWDARAKSFVSMRHGSFAKHTHARSTRPARARLPRMVGKIRSGGKKALAGLRKARTK